MAKFTSEAALTAALATKFPAPAYCFLSQVRNGTGYTRTTRTADAIVMSLWPSRGLELYGFEIKTSRSDWLQELRRPDKADEIAQRCDRWYIVVSNREIVEDIELPKQWGLIAPKGSKLAIIKEAPVLMHPKPLDRPFLAALLRRVHESQPAEQSIAARVEAEKAAIIETTEKKLAALSDYRIKALERDKTHLQAVIDETSANLKAFEEASGVHLADRWNGKKIGDIVRVILHNEHLSYAKGLKAIETHIANISASVRNALSTIEPHFSKNSTDDAATSCDNYDISVDKIVRPV